jgi:hypothetical protein
MTDEIEKRLKRLERPPSGPNFVQLLDETPVRVAKKIIRFVKINYLSSYGAIKDYLRLSADLETLRKAISRSGPPLGRTHNLSLLNAFAEYEELRDFRKLRYLDFEKFYYRVSPELLVPISPTALAVKDGKYLFLTVCGWNNYPLTETQGRYLWTMLEDAVFTLSDFRNANAEYLHFPKQTVVLPEGTVQEVRQPKIVTRGEYKTYSKAEMDELSEIFLAGRDLAKTEIKKDTTVEVVQHAPNEEIDQDEQDDLFP